MLKHRFKLVGELVSVSGGEMVIKTIICRYSPISRVHRYLSHW